jgi:glutamate synthase (NADPH/NADH) large chain
MHAREGVLESDLFKEDLAKTLPVIETEVSDSGSFDNVLEFLMMNGRTAFFSSLILASLCQKPGKMMPI